MEWKKHLTAEEAASIATGSTHSQEAIDALKLLGEEASTEQINAIAAHQEKEKLKSALQKEVLIAEQNENGLRLENSCLELKKVPLVKNPAELLSRPPRSATRMSIAQLLIEVGEPDAANRVIENNIISYENNSKNIKSGLQQRSLSEPEDQLNAIINQRSTGGMSSLYKNHEETIIQQIKKYLQKRDNGIKYTQKDAVADLQAEICLNIDVRRFSDWLKSYKKQGYIYKKNPVSS